MSLTAGYRIGIYYLTLLLFGAFGLGLNAVCLLVPVAPSPRSTRFFQRVIHRHFQLFVWWIDWIRVVRVEYDPALADLPKPVVVVANHPGLMDITYLLARIPEAICLFKPAIRRNPILGAAARRAGYIMSSDGVDALRTAVAAVERGSTLIIFPEGTRTPAQERLGPMRPGFAVIAQRARAPVQLVHIECNSEVLSKRHVWWKPPQFPVTVRLVAGPRLVPDTTMPAATLAATAEQWLRTRAEQIKPPRPRASSVGA